MKYTYESYFLHCSVIILGIYVYMCKPSMLLSLMYDRNKGVKQITTEFIKIYLRPDISKTVHDFGSLVLA